MSGGLVVGFDLDMTLVDSRPGIAAILHRLNAESAYGIDVERHVEVLGPPLSHMLAPYLAPEQLAPAIARFRALYPSVAIEPTALLPGARAALAAVRDLGGRIVVLTGKHEPNALLHLQHLDLPYDRLIGDRWEAGKTEALREEGADVYVGDHEGDMRSAKAAGAIAVGVPTGGIGPDALRAAGADVLLAGLDELPGWLAATYG